MTNNHYSRQDALLKLNLQQGFTLQRNRGVRSSLAALTGNIWSWLKMTMAYTMHVMFPGLPHINQRATTSAPAWQCKR